MTSHTLEQANNKITDYWYKKLQKKATKINKSLIQIHR